MNHRIFAISLFSALLVSSAAHAAARQVITLPLRQALALAQHEYFLAAEKMIEAAEAVPYQSDEEKAYIAQTKRDVLHARLAVQQRWDNSTLMHDPQVDVVPQTMPGTANN
jgi:hypothetical protein